MLVLAWRLLLVQLMLRRFISLFLFLFLISGPAFAEPQCEGVLCNSGRNSHNPQQGLFSAFIDPRFNRQAALVQGVGSIFDATVGRLGRWGWQQYREAWLPGLSPYGGEAALNQIGEAVTVEMTGVAAGGMVSGAVKAGRFAREMAAFGDDLAAAGRAGIQEGLTAEFSRVPDWTPPVRRPVVGPTQIVSEIIDPHYNIIRMGEQQYVEFNAAKASLPQPIVKYGGGGNKQAFATINPNTGRVEVFEGRHRATATAAGDRTVAIEDGAVRDQPGWLRYRFEDYTGSIVQEEIRYMGNQYIPTPMSDLLQKFPHLVGAARSGNPGHALHRNHLKPRDLIQLETYNHRGDFSTPPRLPNVPGGWGGILDR